MDFFRSVFSEEPSSPNSENTPPSSPNSRDHDQNPNPNPSPNPVDLPAISTAWSFGSTLFKTIATKSESFVETYRRDLEEFSSGLKKETATIRQVASRAVQDLPSRIESGASVAQTSLETVGQAIDNIADVIVTRGKDSISILTSDDYYSDSELSQNAENFNERNANIDLNYNKPYSRIELAIRTIQCDLKTYREEPEDLEEYSEWRKGFVLEDKSEEIESLVAGNTVLKQIYGDVVPDEIDHETFWSRYFYRVYRLKKVEEARVRLVERAISGEEDEDLSWDVDDDEEEESEGSSKGFKTMELQKEVGESGKKVEGLTVGDEEKGDESSEGFKMRHELENEVEESEKKMEDLSLRDDEKDFEMKRGEKVSVSETKGDSGVEEKGIPDEVESSDNKALMKSDEKASSDGRNDNSDFSVVSSQPSHEEEDIGWDEIEDIGSGDESKVTTRASDDRADLRKRLSVAEEEEDLSWDIEDDDDDEPTKS